MAHPSRPGFSLVILCYRSEERIVPIVEHLHRMLSCFRLDHEVLLVGNYFEGSGDRTPEVVQSLAQRLPNTRAIVQPKQGMMGWDMRSGMDAARGELIGLIDGDGQFPLESIFSCLLKALTEDYDLVKTYRVSRQDGLYRRVISRLYNAAFRLLFRTPYRDVNSKPKILRREAYERMQLRSDDWFTDAEIMIRAQELGLRVAELPILFYEIEGRSSFVRPAAILEFVANLWRYRFGRPERRAAQ